MINVRQGDVLLIAVPLTKKIDAKPGEKDPRGLVLGEGDSSAHYHVARGADCTLSAPIDASGKRLLTTGEDGAELVVVGGESGGVPRHEPIAIPRGQYLLMPQRAFTSALRSRRVED